MATTTFDAIRDTYVTAIRAVTFSTAPDDAFDYVPERMMLRDFVDRTGGSACFRKFEFVRTGTGPDPAIMHPEEVDREEFAEVLIAYPVTVALYGINDLLDVEKVMRADARKVNDVLRSTANYTSGQNAAFTTIGTPDRSQPDIWYQPLSVRLLYNEAQAIT